MHETGKQYTECMCSFFYSDIVISMSSQLGSTTSVSGIVIHIGTRSWPGLGLWTHVRVGIGHWSVVGISFIWSSCRWCIGPAEKYVVQNIYTLLNVVSFGQIYYLPIVNCSNIWSWGRESGWSSWR